MTIFFTEGVVECNIAHSRSVAVVGIVYRRQYTYSSRYTDSRCVGHTSVYLCACLLQNLAVLKTFISLSVYLCGTVLRTQYLMVWDWRVLRTGPRFFLFTSAASSIFFSYCFYFLFLHSLGWYCRAGVFGLIVC